jgi:hypothetical protein
MMTYTQSSFRLTLSSISSPNWIQTRFCELATISALKGEIYNTCRVSYTAQSCVAYFIVVLSPVSTTFQVRNAFFRQCITAVYPVTKLNKFTVEISKLKVLDRINHVFFYYYLTEFTAELQLVLVSTVTLGSESHRDSWSYIYIFIAAITCLSRCLATTVFSGSTIPTLRRHVTLLPA